MNRIALVVPALAAFMVCAHPAAAQGGEVPDTVGNFGVFHLPARSLDENHDQAVVASSDADRMSGVSWSCRGRRTVVVVLLDRQHGFTGTAVRLVYRFDHDPPHTTVVRSSNDTGTLYGLPAGEVRAFSARAVAASRLTLRAVTPRGRRREYVFDLTGAPDALASLPCTAALRLPPPSRHASAEPRNRVEGVAEQPRRMHTP
jgi:hypothetical protein